MEQGQLFRQMIEFNKMAFDNTFGAIVMFQEQLEKMTSAMLIQSTWLPEDGRKAVDEWIKSYKKGRDDFKKVVDEGFQKVESFFNRPDAEQKSKAF
jgi:hypothetical protein